MKKRVSKGLASVLVFLLLVTGAFPILGAPAFAAENDTGADGDFTWIELADGTVKVTEYTGVGGNVEVPVLLSEKTVSEIDGSVFAGNTTLTGISILADITEIATGSFLGCTSLTDVTLPDGLEAISGEAFKDCTSLAAITIPDSVTAIDFGAFKNDTLLSNVTLSTDLETIGTGAFAACTALDSITLPAGLTGLGENAFSGTALSDITIPDGVTDIENSTFEGCTALQTITLPALLESIGSAAFSGCTSLGTVVVPDTVTEIGTEAFKDCSLLASATLPAALDTLGGDAFNGCADLVSVDIPDGVTGVEFGTFKNCGSLESAELPAGLLSIGESAFEGCSSLQNITLPSSMTSLGERAFAESALQYIEIPSGIADVAAGAFSDCSDFEEVTFHEGLKNINEAAFYNTNLFDLSFPVGLLTVGDSAFAETELSSDVSIPASVTSISPFAFTGCEFDRFYVSSGSATYKAVNGVLYNKAVTEIVLYPPGKYDFLTLPSTVTTIGPYSLQQAQISGLVIPEGVTSIPDKTIFWCDNLSFVSLPTTLTDIGEENFVRCGNLSQITIPENVTTIESYCFADCEYLEKAVFKGDAPASFGDDEFEGVDEDWFTIYYPYDANGWSSPLWNGFNAEAYDPADAFHVYYDANGATIGTAPRDNNVYFEGDATEVLDGVGLGMTGGVFAVWNTEPDGSGYDYYAEEYFPVEEDITFYAQYELGYQEGDSGQWTDGTVTYHYTTLDDTLCRIDFCEGAEGDYTIPGSIEGLTVVEIGEGAYAGNDEITSLTFPGSLKIIDMFAFEACDAIETIMIPEGVVTIRDYAFAGCSSIQTASIPASVTKLGTAFAGCSELIAINVASGNPNYSSTAGVLFNKSQTTLIQYPANKSGSTYTIPSTVVRIGDDAFMGTKLTSVTIPNSVTEIGFGAFYESALTSVSLSRYVEDIGYWAFAFCQKLTAINVNTSNPYYKSVSGVLFSKDGAELLQYPAGNTLTSYTVPSGVYIIGNSAFEGSMKLTAVTIPSGVDYIGGYAFGSCTALKTINIANGVQMIGGGAFAFCISLTSVTLPASVEYIDGFLFDYCYGLTTINVAADNEYYTSVDGVLFDKGKTELVAYPIGNSRTSYDIPEGVEYIDDYAFEGSEKLTGISIPESAGYVSGDAFADCSKLVALGFSGDAPYGFEDSFWFGDFTIYYNEDRDGWDEPEWNGYSSEGLSIESTSASAVSAGYDKVTISWNNVAGANGYIVYRSTKKAGVYSKIATVSSGSTFSYTNTGLTTNKTYYYKVCAYVSKSGAKVRGTQSSSCSTVPVPAAPAISLASTSFTAIRVSWNAVSGATGYEVWGDTQKSGTYSLKYTSNSSTAGSWTKTGLTTDKVYYYKVRAFRTVSGVKVYGTDSAIQSTAPGRASIIVARASSTSAKISWVSISGSSGYEVWRSTQKNGTYALKYTASSSATSWTNKSLTTGKAYYYKVRSYKMVSGQKVYGQFSAINSIVP